MIADFDADADTHFCLKCHSTIIGLDNYVTHKKTGCEKIIPGTSKSPLPSQLLPPDDIVLKADDFFSSLELRSSSKKPAVPPTTTGGKTVSGILTRSKTTAAIQASSTSTSKDQSINAHHHSEPPQSKSGKNVWIGGHQLKELGHGDNQSKLIKAVDNLERRKEELPRIGVFDESDDEFDEFIDYDDESSDDDDDLPRHQTGGKWKPQSPIQWPSREKEWVEPPVPIGGGKWKPGAGKRAPSPNYTKGKWKPDPKEIELEVDPNIPPPTYTGSKWVPLKKQDYQSASTLGYNKNKWKMLKIENEEECPPPNVKGKWKPKQECDYDAPPPNHTKSKWSPKFEDIDSTSPPSQTKSKGKSKIANDTTETVLENQTKGKLIPKMEPHVNSLKTEGADNEQSSASSEEHKQIDTETPPVSYTKGKWKPKMVEDNQNIKESETETKPLDGNNSANNKPKIQNVKITDESFLRKSSWRVQYWCSPCNRRLASKLVYDRHLRSSLHFKRTRPECQFDDGGFIGKKIGQETDIVNKDIKTVVSSKKRNRRKIYEICTVCQSRVNKTSMGKHLISHYHCRKGDVYSEAASKMVLENIQAIILESPFQCCVCTFYCNTHEQFLLHWESDFHKTYDQKYNGYFLCIFCKHTCISSEDMLLHLTSGEHLDVVSVINRSVPITIKKIKELSCLTCEQKFTLNIQLLNHCRKTNHDASNVNIFSKDSYFCKDCNKYFYTPLSMQRHRKKVHRHEYFYCSTCDLKFNLALEAKQHRTSQVHRYKMLEKVKPVGASLKRKCEYCAEFFDNFLQLKNHLKDMHPEHKIRCPHCGANFIITQELTNHLRSKSCKFEEKPLKQATENTLHCEKCPFTSESTSELLFHVALHDEPILMYPLDEDGNEVQIKPLPRYKCPICEKVFPKNSLRDHIRQHTQERPYVCQLCGAGFARKNNLLYHEKNHQRKGKCQIKKKTDGKPFLCAMCGAGFKKKYTLQQHMMIHTGKSFKCPHLGCFYTARKISEVKEHGRIHSDSKNFSCHLCDYRGKTKGLLQKHLKIHQENNKKFHCSQCSFTARTPANLKRHTRLHTGSKPFKCPHCEYKCNTYENLRKHVLSTTKHTGKTIFECKFCESGGPLFKTNFAKDFKHHLMTDHAKSFANSTEAATYVAGIYEAQDDNQVITVEDGYLEDDPAGDRSAVAQSSSKPMDHGKHISTLRTKEDPLFMTEQPTKDKVLDQILPMFVIPKDDRVGNTECTPDSWSLVGRYDVEESGTLVPFQSEGDVLFQEDF